MEKQQRYAMGQGRFRLRAKQNLRKIRLSSLPLRTLLRINQDHKHSFSISQILKHKQT